jgi:hypothetical protein
MFLILKGLKKKSCDINLMYEIVMNIDECKKKKKNLGFETQFHLVEKTFVFNYKHVELLKFFPHQKVQVYLTTIYMFSQTTLLALPTKARILC